MLVNIGTHSISTYQFFFLDDIAENNESTLVDDKSKDKDYEQADEVDDETTMEEEEALPELEDPLREIRFLEEVSKP